MLKPIPTREEPGEYTQLLERDSGFIELKNGEPFFVQMQYPCLNMRYAETRCLIREELYERLLAAQNALPDGMCLCIWDAWRPFLLQKELYERYYEQIVQEFHLEGKGEESSLEVAHEHLNGIYDISLSSEWIYPISGMVFCPEKKEEQ